jgi:hypothetical protein
MIDSQKFLFFMLKSGSDFKAIFKNMMEVHGTPGTGPNDRVP